LRGGGAEQQELHCWSMDEGFLERRQAGARRAFGRAIYEGGDLWRMPSRHAENTELIYII